MGAANTRFCSMKFSIYKQFCWLNNVFLFSTEIGAKQLKKITLGELEKISSFENKER